MESLPDARRNIFIFISEPFYHQSRLLLFNSLFYFQLHLIWFVNCVNPFTAKLFFNMGRLSYSYWG